MQDKQEQQAKAKITIAFPDGEVETFESNAIAVVAAVEGGVHLRVYTKDQLMESIKLLVGLNVAKRKVLNSNPIFSLFGEEIAKCEESILTEMEEGAFKNLTGGGG